MSTIPNKMITKLLRVISSALLLLPLLAVAKTPEAVAKGESFVIDNDFRADPIPDAVFERMKGKSYPKDCTINRKDLRYVKVLISDGKGGSKPGEMVVNKAIAKDVVEIFHELYHAGYPIERMELIDNYDAVDDRSMRANNSSSFCYRVVAGTKKLSNHARGLAIDINPLYNPWVHKNKAGKTLVDPKAGEPYADRTKSFPYKIDKSDLAYKVFKKHGFTWGGEWNSSKDYQHFEKAVK